MNINTPTAPTSVNGILKRSCGIGIKTCEHDSKTCCHCYEKGTVIILLCDLV